MQDFIKFLSSLTMLLSAVASLEKLFAGPPARPISTRPRSLLLVVLMVAGVLVETFSQQRNRKQRRR